MTTPSERRAVLRRVGRLTAPHGPDHRGCRLCRLALEYLRDDAADFFADIRRRQFAKIEGGVL